MKSYTQLLKKTLNVSVETVLNTINKIIAVKRQIVFVRVVFSTLGFLHLPITEKQY